MGTHCKLWDTWTTQCLFLSTMIVCSDCLFLIPAPRNCTFTSGDGRGSSEVKIGQQTGDECVQACIARKKSDENINGVTIYQNERGGCWCEKKMTSITESIKYKTCFLQPSGNKT